MVPPIVHVVSTINGKKQNIFDTNGQPHYVAKVGDLGIARMVDLSCGDVKLTQALGTLEFMPPEGLLAEPI